VRTALAAAVPGLLVATLVLVPFHDKAFTVDDPIFMREAEHALEDPLHPTAFVYPWFGAPRRVSEIAPSGPLGAWLLVPAALAGGSETIAHLTILAFLGAGIVACVTLALRLGLSPLASASAGVLLAADPAVAVMAGTAMPDVPAMALGVAGMERLVAWRSGRRVVHGVMAAMLLGLAVLARSHAMLLLPIGAVLLVDEPREWRSWRRTRAVRWWPLGAAGLAALAVNLATKDPSSDSGSIAGSVANLVNWNALASNLVAFPVHWVLTTTLGIAWMGLRWRSLAQRWYLPLAGGVAAALLLRWGHGAWVHLPAAAVAGLGLAVLADVVIDAKERRDVLQVVLWLWLLPALAAVAYLHLPAKYLVPSAPAAAILLARRLAERPRVGAAIATVTMALGVTLSVAMLRADAVVAGFARNAAQGAIAPRTRAGESVWYVGQWGFQWYAERAGAQCLSAVPPYPAPGDVIVSCQHCGPPVDMSALRSILVPIARLEDTTPGGRLMDMDSGAGFYSNYWGYLPWAWSDGPVEIVDVWRLVGAIAD
jgi:4-amino-4-deoxy-L-arabinose transferase-like glycosyltransferase